MSISCNTRSKLKNQLKQAWGSAPHEFSNPASDRVWFLAGACINAADKGQQQTCIHHGMLAVYSQPGETLWQKF